MKKSILILIGLLSFSPSHSASVKVTTSVSASVDRVGDAELPGLLFKIDLPAELQGARIDLAYLRFKVQADTAKTVTGFLVRPMLDTWSPGSRINALSDSAASPNHVDFGQVNFKRGTGQIEITQIVRAWQGGELSNFGLLVYPTEALTSSLQLRSSSSGAAELEIFYTAAEKQ